MKAARARNLWQVVVGFLLGGTAANFVGVPSIVLYQAAHGQFSYVHLLYLSPRERFVWMAAPLILAALLLRSRPYVAVGMVLSAVALWFLSAPISGRGML